METKKCPACAEEIKKEAKKCPKCQKDLRNWFVRHPFLSIILFIFLIGIFGDITSKQYVEDVNNNINIENTSTTTVANNTNLNGIWIKSFYVDDFGDKTKEGYITTNGNIYGTFSNTATTNSKLKVNLLINNKDEIYIQLYEYAGNTPVMGTISKSYNIFVKDKDGNKSEFYGYNHSDRIIIEKRISTDLGPNDLHNILLKGGKIDFVIKETGFPSEYSFSIDNANGYSNLFK